MDINEIPKVSCIDKNLKKALLTLTRLIFITFGSLILL